MEITAALLLVCSTVFVGYGVMWVLTANIEDRSVIPGGVTILLGLLAFWTAGYGAAGGYGIRDIPVAFVEVAAWILR